MARKTRKKKPSGSTAGRKPKYSAGELFIAIIGALLVVLFGGIILTALLGG